MGGINHRLYFVLDTIIKCIWIKIQLIVEFNLGFQDFANIIYPPQKKSTTYGRILGQFYADDEIQPVFLRPDTFLYTAENGELIQPQVVLRR